MDNPRIGVYVCHCGTNISKMVDVVAVAEAMAKQPNVVVSKEYKYMCSDPGQDLIIKDIHENNLNRIVVAACSPRMHEPTFRKALEKAGLNPYYFEMANIREQDSWVHTDKAIATQKAKYLIKSAIAKVALNEPLEKREVEINPSTIVIGAGISGIAAALNIADAGKQVFLVERTERLGGIMADLDITYPYLDNVSELLNPLTTRVINHPNIKLHLNSTVKEIKGYIGNFEAIITSANKTETEVKIGNIIVTTGVKTFNPDSIEEYNYKKIPNIVTSIEFEKMISRGDVSVNNPKYIAIINCVGSLNKKYHEYCSRVCCSSALKYANQLSKMLPDSFIFNLYTDMRAFGLGCEELYTQTSRSNTTFLMFNKDELPKVRKANEGSKCAMYIEINEKISGETVDVPADLIILMVGMEAQVDAKEVAHLVGISMCQNDFYIERHPKLDPVATTTDGVFIAGGCQGPKDINDCISQAQATAARVLGLIARGRVQVESTTSFINDKQCSGCKTCVKMCPYGAIYFDEEKKVSIVNEILCKGCGTCTAACPSSAITSRHFTDRQIISQIKGLLIHEDVYAGKN